MEIEISDYHLTPMDYYCHETISLGAKIRLDIPFIEGNQRILASTVSHKPEIPESQIIQEEQITGEIPSRKEPIIEDEEKGYSQISIFDDIEEN